MVMGFNVKRTMMWPNMILFLSAVISVSLSQKVTVSMEPSYYSDPAMSSALLTCDFSVDDGTYNFFNLEWRIDGTIVADFYNGANDPLYQNDCSVSGACTIMRTNDMSNFTITSLDISRNKDTFSCLVTFQSGTTRKTSQDSAFLVVVVPTKTIEISSESLPDMPGNTTIGTEVNLSLDVDSHIFQCKVANINPQAKFNWTVGDERLPSDNITEDHVVDRVTGLTTSTSNVTLAPKQRYNGKNLTCKAVNYEGDPGVMFYLVLKVKDPCDTYDKCENDGTCFIDPDDPSEVKCNCTVGYEGIFCEKVITTAKPATTPPPTKTTETPATLSFGVILGIIAGCVCLVLIIIACGIAIWKYNNKTEVSPESNQNKNGKKKEVDGKVDV